MHALRRIEPALHHLVERLEHGEAVMSRDQVEDWLETMERTSICGLGQAAPIPFRNAARHWPDLLGPLGEARGQTPGV